MARAADNRYGETDRRQRRRLRVLVVLSVLVTAGFGARAASLQLVQTDGWRQTARAQTATRVEVPAERGGLYDRAGRPLVVESPKFRAYLAPGETGDPAAAAATIGRVLGLSPAEERTLREARGGWAAVPRRLSSDERDRLRTAIRQGLYFDRIPARVHPQGDVALPLLGSLDSEGAGRSGLELALDSLLRGRSGSALNQRDARGGLYPLPGAEVEAPEPGHDVVLTLDLELQELAENTLDRALRETGAAGGDVVMADPSTGEILALASRRPGAGMRVPALTDPYEPGSTLKPFLLAGLLSEGEAALAEMIDTEGGRYRLNGRLIRDVHPNDSLRVAEVIQHSSNIGAVKLASRLSPGQQYRYLRDFGFGVPAGVEYPAEAGGHLRPVERWSSFSQASLAMGYEISVTSLQLVAAYGALANGGVLMRPYLVREVRAPGGERVRRRDPEPVRRVIHEEVAERVTRVLSSVVDGGTGSRAALATLPVAGKTGTAHIAAAGGYAEGRYAASFVGYMPAEDPDLVILTTLEDPQGDYYGGLTAAPVSRATLQAAMATRGVTLPANDPGWSASSRFEWGARTQGRRAPDAGPFIFAVSGPSSSWPAEAPSSSAHRVLPDLRGLPVRVAVARLHELGMRAELRANGRVEGQDPPPGQKAPVGATVRLR